MAEQHHPELLGFDSFELKLGDELRGERASKGKSLMDVQRELRIRAEYISAIEDANADVFPNDGFAAGYIRSYARYLDLDPDDVYRRFCDEAGVKGFTPVTSIEPSLGGGEREVRQSRRRVDDLVVNTRFATSNAREARLDLGASLRGLASICVLAGLIGGLGFGGWTVLQNLQRVGFAPLPSAPEVIISAPDVFEPAPVETVAAPAPVQDGERLSLLELYAEQENAAPLAARRDGPISSIDPDLAGVYAPPAPIDAPEPSVAELDVEAPALGLVETASYDEAILALVEPEPALANDRLGIYVTDEAWLQVRDAGGKVLFSGTLGSGEHYPLPLDAEGPVLRAGNAGAVYLVIGPRAFGPLGDGPVVAKNVALTAEAIEAEWPVSIGVEPPVIEAAEAEGEEDLAQLPQ